MRTLGTCHVTFPSRPTDPDWQAGESDDWKPTVRLRALASRVLVVAQTRIEGTWSAYCGPVPGIDHRREWQEVLNSGDKLREVVARAIFPEFEGVPYHS